LLTAGCEIVPKNKRPPFSLLHKRDSNSCFQFSAPSIQEMRRKSKRVILHLYSHAQPATLPARGHNCSKFRIVERGGILCPAGRSPVSAPEDGRTPLSNIRERPYLARRAECSVPAPLPCSLFRKGAWGAVAALE